MKVATSDRYAAMLTGLPATLNFACAILRTAFQPGHEQADDLLRRIGDCALQAQVLLLSSETESFEGGRDDGQSAGT